MTQRLTDEQRELVEKNLWIAHWAVKRYAKQARGKFEFDDFLSAAYYGLCLAALKFDPDLGFKFVSLAQHYCWREIRFSIRRRPVIRTPTRHEDATQVPFDPDQASAVQQGNDRADYSSELTAAIRRLPKRERFIIEQLREGLRQTEIAAILVVSRERVRQIKDRAINRIRRQFQRAGIPVAISGDTCSVSFVSRKSAPNSDRPIRLRPSASKKSRESPTAVTVTAAQC